PEELVALAEQLGRGRLVLGLARGRSARGHQREREDHDSERASRPSVAHRLVSTGPLIFLRKGPCGAPPSARCITMATAVSVCAPTSRVSSAYPGARATSLCRLSLRGTVMVRPCTGAPSSSRVASPGSTSTTMRTSTAGAGAALDAAGAG